MSHTTVVTYPDFREEQDFGGKFLHIMLRGKEYLLFATSDQHQFHNQILAHFLADQDIPFYWVSEENLQIEEPAITIHGGGRFQLDIKRQILHLRDNSQAYGRFDDQRVRQSLAAAGGMWNRLKLCID